MANLRDLRRRIKSVKNTSQITKAMQMVSATKMRKAQNQALSSRPYTSTLSAVLSQILSGSSEISHPLVLENDSDKTVVLLVSSNKGLCGALNTNIFRSVQTNEIFKSANMNFASIGKKGRDFIVRTGRNLDGDFENNDLVKFSEAVKLRKFLVENFLSGNIGKAYLLYPQFISTLRQEPKLLSLLPIDKSVLITWLENETKDEKKLGEFLFEPNMESLLDYTLTHYLDTQIYQALLESKASEHSARMIAMQNATNNAKELVEDLTLTYNGLRQENITRELLEIISAGAALG